MTGDAGSERSGGTFETVRNVVRDGDNQGPEAGKYGAGPNECRRIGRARSGHEARGAMLAGVGAKNCGRCGIRIRVVGRLHGSMMSMPARRCQAGMICRRGGAAVHFARDRIGGRIVLRRHAQARCAQRTLYGQRKDQQYQQEAADSSHGGNDVTTSATRLRVGCSDRRRAGKVPRIPSSITRRTTPDSRPRLRQAVMHKFSLP
jgi:hypothetical protein